MILSTTYALVTLYSCTSTHKVYVALSYAQIAHTLSLCKSHCAGEQLKQQPHQQMKTCAVQLPHPQYEAQVQQEQWCA